MQAGSLDRVDRRLAAILAADAVGYSRLMEADERGTLERLKICTANWSIRQDHRRLAARGSTWEITRWLV